MKKMNQTNPDIFRKKNMPKALMLIYFLSLFLASCSKSSSTASQTTPACTTDICRLTSHKWVIASQAIYTDMGVFTYTAEQIATENWATFLFRPDSTYTTYGGQTQKYTYTESTKKLVLVDNLLPLHFDLSFPTRTTMSFTGGKIQMNPRTDSSEEAYFAINNVGGSLYNDFGVDTSKIHYIQAVFTYNGF